MNNNNKEVARAEKNTICCLVECCNDAVIRFKGLNFCESCRLQIGGPISKTEFRGAGLRIFRNDGNGGVETRCKGDFETAPAWENCSRGKTIYIGMHNAENARAWANAMEDK